MMPFRTFRPLFTCWALIAAATAAADESSLWRISFATDWLGPAEAFVRIDATDGELRGTSLSGATALLAELPGDQALDDGLVAFEARLGDDGSYSGTFTAPWREGRLHFTIDGDRLRGNVEGGAFDGSIEGERASRAGAIRDYPALLASFDAVVAARVFDRAGLDSPAYLEFRETFGRIAAAATDDFDLLFGFAWSWNNEPFSHFSLKRSVQSAEQMFAMFDAYRVGFEAATVEFEDDVAILTVRTMMGADTIEQIVAAYEQIAAAAPGALVIDLRGNNGGAFAVKPLVEHVIDGPIDAGYFLSQAWSREHDRLPTSVEVMAADPWQGWSIVSFWQAVQELPILRVRFRPAEPNFDGPVYVLLDDRTASAGEMAKRAH